MSEESARLLTQLLDILGKLAESLKADIIKDSAPRPWWKEGAKVKAEDVEASDE